MASQQAAERDDFVVSNALYMNCALIAPILQITSLGELWPGQPLRLNDSWLHVHYAARMGADHTSRAGTLHRVWTCECVLAADHLAPQVHCGS